MAEFYVMPSISPTMESGTLVTWRIAEGARFESGAVMAEVGTDKANMEAEIFDEGVLIRHLVAEGDEIPPGFPIAIWGASADEDVSALLAAFAERKASLGGAPAAEPAPAPAPEPAPAPAPPKPVAAAEPGRVERTWMGQVLPPDFADTTGDLRYGPTRRVVASPLARRIAADTGVDLARVQGSGPGGRIVAADVQSAPTAPVAAAPQGRADEAVRLSPMRKTIAKRLLASHQEIPSFTLTAALDVQGFVDLRERLKAAAPDVKVSYNDLLIACVARALREFPAANASWGDKAITRHGSVDIGVAVAVDEGLITPVLRAADTLSLSQIGGRVRELAGKARDGKLDPSEYSGNTFTISNLGMYGIDHFTAIINPPASAILAVGRMAQVPVVVDGTLTVGWRMNVTLTCDHRVIDGAVGARFLEVLRRYVEAPTLLLV